MTRRRARKGAQQDLRRNFNEMKNDPAAKYIRANFEPDDRLALVLLNKRTKGAIQQLSRAEKIAASDTQKWLRFMNAQKFEVYVSMNTLREGARGRTKADIAEIRHVYLDLDEDASKALDLLLARKDLPEPNFVLNSSPEKYQVIWKVQGFSQHQAETLQRSLARDTGADPAATDSSRVLRLPGFYNHKYAQSHYVRAEPMCDHVYGPECFPEFGNGEAHKRTFSDGPQATATRGARSGGDKSQSEHDWAYALRALSRGESQERVIEAIAAYREGEKRQRRRRISGRVWRSPSSLGERGTPRNPLKRRSHIMAKQKPAAEIRIGSIKAAIWKNETEKSTRHNVTFQRLYRDGDEWKTTQSFGRDELLLLA